MGGRERGRVNTHGKVEKSEFLGDTDSAVTQHQRLDHQSTVPEEKQRKEEQGGGSEMSSVLETMSLDVLP